MTLLEDSYQVRGGAQADGCGNRIQVQIRSREQALYFTVEMATPFGTQRGPSAPQMALQGTRAHGERGRELVRVEQAMAIQGVTDPTHQLGDTRELLV